MQACKPGSVPQQVEALIIYLSRQVGINRSTHHAIPVAPPKFKSPRRIKQHDLFDLSTRKVYHAPFIAAGTVGSYPTFSLSPQSDRIGSWLLIFCGTLCQLTVCSKMPAFSYGTMPDVARTFLPDGKVRAIRRLASCKNNEIARKNVLVNECPYR